MTGIVAVTGAAGALGRKTVEILGAAGWTVVGIDLGEVAADSVALALGGLDLTDEAAMAGAAAQISAELGQLDGLV
ncbi:MAG: SDR family NAD(P)-dependent oxidoreductase, partial [Alphaproteobacteria bacterium]